jgi:Fe-S cluster assembly iron-binding protein IscA
MALDESQEEDQVFTEKGVTFLVNSELFEKVKPINVEFVTSVHGSGFKVASALDAASACGPTCSC